MTTTAGSFPALMTACPLLSLVLLLPLAMAAPKPAANPAPAVAAAANPETFVVAKLPVSTVY